MTDARKVNERELALEILLLVTKDGVKSHLAIGQVLEKYQYLEKKSRAFITRLTQGTLERLIELDYVIDQFSRTPVKDMKPVIRCILRSGVYQLLYMDSVPASAACNEAVELAQRKGFRNLKGFVNGILRSIARALEAGKIAYPDPETEPLRAMSIRYSMPEWILELWGRSYDDETVENMCRALLLDRPTAIRVNMEHTSPAELRAGLEQAGIKVEETKLEDAFLISGYDYLGSLPAFLRGDFYVQDLSAMQVAHAADVQPGWNVIDVCAAPGGKAIHVAQLLGGTGHVEARDLTEYKVGLIEENIERCRVENMSVKVWDATQPDTTAADTADLVIADLPCSGLGILHKKPDIKYQMTPAQAGELAALQRRILAQVQHFVKPGGRLLYSTCTVNPAENEENADWFADSFPDFTKRSGQQILPDEIRDGFYIAVFDRRT